MRAQQYIKNKYHQKLQAGISLMEILIVITILSLIFLAISFAVSQSLKRAQFNQDKLLGTRYAEELEEWLRGEKEVDWNTFYTTYAGTPNTYCFDDSVYSGKEIQWPSEGACSTEVYGLRDTFKREVVLTQDGSSQVLVEIEVTWRDGPNIFSVPIDTIFSSWE